MQYVIVILVYGLILDLLYITRKTLKKLNPRYSLFDDLLLWTGIPATFGYLMYIIFNPENNNKLVSEVVKETQNIMIPLLIWMVIGTLWYLWRNRSSKRFY